VDIYYDCMYGVQSPVLNQRNVTIGFKLPLDRL